MIFSLLLFMSLFFLLQASSYNFDQQKSFQIFSSRNRNLQNILSHPQKTLIAPIKSKTPLKTPAPSQKFDQSLLQSKQNPIILKKNIPLRGLRIGYELYDPQQKQTQDYKQQINYVQDVFSISIQYFEKLIQVRPKDFYLSSYEDTEFCKKYKNSDKQDEWNDKSFDIYLFVKVLDTISELAQATTCLVTQNNYPKFGVIGISRRLFLTMTKVNNKQEYFQRDVSTIIHEIIHVLGFNPTSMPKEWVKGKDDYIKSNIWRGKETVLLASPHVLTAIRKHYNCPQIEGIPLQTWKKNNKLSYKGHFNEQLVNEVMSPDDNYSSGFIQTISEFTAAVLKDTGYFVEINKSLIESYRQNQNSNCLQFFKECKPIDDSKKTCDPYHQGVAFCLISNEQGCCLEQIYQGGNCQDGSFQNTPKLHNQFGTSKSVKSMCFNSSLNSEISQPNSSIQVTGKCYKTECIDNIVYIFVGKIKNQCRFNQEKIKIKGYSGYLICPDNLTTFCQIKRKCLNDCSGNGICIKGKCSCLKRFKGDDCSLHV